MIATELVETTHLPFCLRRHHMVGTASPALRDAITSLAAWLPPLLALSRLLHATLFGYACFQGAGLLVGCFTKLVCCISSALLAHGCALWDVEVMVCSPSCFPVFVLLPPDLCEMCPCAGLPLL